MTFRAARADLSDDLSDDLSADLLADLSGTPPRNTSQATFREHLSGNISGHLSRDLLLTKGFVHRYWALPPIADSNAMCLQVTDGPTNQLRIASAGRFRIVVAFAPSRKQKRNLSTAGSWCLVPSALAKQQQAPSDHKIVEHSLFYFVFRHGVNSGHGQHQPRCKHAAPLRWLRRSVKFLLPGSALISGIALCSAGLFWPAPRGGDSCARSL